jgi:ATP-dependent exoDNAse (exonuclease V) beta subunit
MKESILEDLECFKDKEFKFEPGLHKYTHNGDEMVSVTTFIQQFHKKFDKQYWSLRKAHEQNVPQEWIINEWQKLNDYANEIGTDTHNWIEDYFKGNWNKLPTNLDVINRINKFNIVYAENLYKLEPLKFELKVFSKKWKLAGTIDSLFMYRGKLVIVDWKTNKKFDTDETLKYKERLFPPFHDFNKSHLSKYSIQISLYSLILKEWGFNVSAGYLVHIGPGDEPAKIYKCINMVGILEEYLNGSQY